MCIDPSPPSCQRDSGVPTSSRIPRSPTAPYVGLGFKGGGVINFSFSFAFSVERLGIVVF